MAIVLLLRSRHAFNLYPKCVKNVSTFTLINVNRFKPSILSVYNKSFDLKCLQSSKCGQEVTMKSKLKKAVAEYGTTVIVFHVTISLISLGICYFLIANGIDLEQYLEKLGLAEKKIATNAGVFLTAYAVHKLFAPVRIAITLGSTPVIVRYLRNKGILKKPIKTPKI